MSKIRLMLVEDDSLLRRTLVSLLQLDGDVEVVGEFGNGEAAVAHLEECRPDVVLTDIDMPRLSGIEATRQMRAIRPDLPVVILTKFGDDENVFSALKAGALGYVLKDSDLDEIRQAVHDAAAGAGHLSPALVARVLSEFSRVSRQTQDHRKLFAELTHREMEVLELLGAGLRNKTIAERLCLSEKTVKAHVGAILRKLELNDRTEAALLAQQHGLGG